MRRLSWNAGLAGAALIVTTVYAVAQMAPGANAAGADAAGADDDDGNDEADEPDDGSLQQHDAGRPARPHGCACHAGEEGLKAGPIYRCEGPTKSNFKSESREKQT